MKNKISVDKLYENVNNWIVENGKVYWNNIEKFDYIAYIEPGQLKDLYEYLKDNLINNEDISPCSKCDPDTRAACCGCPEYAEFQAKHAKEKKL